MVRRREICCTVVIWYTGEMHVTQVRTMLVLLIEHNGNRQLVSVM
jgi:hypothetical protein